MAIAREAGPVVLDMVSNGEGLSFRYTGYIAESEESKRQTLVGAVAFRRPRQLNAARRWIAEGKSFEEAVAETD